MPRRKKAANVGAAHTLKIPDPIYREVEAFLLTQIAQKNNITSASDLVIRLLVNFFANFKEEYRLFEQRQKLTGGKT